MRLLVLTTATVHHAYFVRELAAIHSQLHVICETKSISPTFDVRHPFEDQRDQHESKTWFGSRQVALSELAETSVYDNVNQPEVVNWITKYQPDATVIFGARKLSRAVIEAAGASLMNLHGGDPEFYRGLDSHLWAIYHDDYMSLVTTLHSVNELLDDGALIGKYPITLDRGMKLYMLRQRNTECALRLTLDVLDKIMESGKIIHRAQRQIGRYYSFMPAVLKSVCVMKFERYCASLP